jgi:hypothetical protein
MSVKIVTPAGPIHTADGAAFANFTTFQDVSPTPSILIPQQNLEAGLDVYLEAMGEFSTTGTPTFALGFWFNTVATVLAQNALTATATTGASWPWKIRYRGRLRVATPSNAASFNGQGEVWVGGSLTAWQTGFPVPIPTTAAARTVTVDTSAARAIGVGAAWGTANASNTLKTNYLSVLLISGY